MLAMLTMGERVRKAMTLRGMTPRDLIAKTGLTKASIYFILDDTTTPDKIRARSALSLSKALSADVEWLLTGRGKMDASTSRKDEPEESAQVTHEDLMMVHAALQSMLKALVETIRPAAAVFSTQIRKVADEIGMPIDKGAWHDMLAIAEQAQAQTVTAAQPSVPRSAGATSKR